MILKNDRAFGAVITRLINRENLTRQEAFAAFSTVLNNATSDLQQGAFLAALTAKGETAEEVAGAWEAIYELDTAKVKLDLAVAENSGTGMDEASVCGTTHCARIRTDAKTGRGTIDQFTIDPVSLGLSCTGGDDLRPEPDRDKETLRFVRLMNNKENSPRKDAVAINAGLDLYTACFAEPVGCVINAFEKMPLAPGKRLLIFGGGTMGLITAIYARQTQQAPGEIPLDRYGPPVVYAQ